MTLRGMQRPEASGHLRKEVIDQIEKSIKGQKLIITDAEAVKEEVVSGSL